jgi:WD40 repeat protein
MTPPWPNKAFSVGHSVRYVAFSPSGSQLTFGTMNNTGQHIVHIWDRWGKETLLGGHTRYIFCLEYSLDGECLASGSGDGLIRIWKRESCHRERPTRTPKQADKILLGSRNSNITALSFSRTDSNILASGGTNGEIKVWNVREQACIHTFNYSGPIRSLFFAGGADIACTALAGTSVIRLWKPEGSSDLASEIIGNADMSGHSVRAVFSPSGSLLATSFRLTGNASTVTLYELDTMTTKIQSLVNCGVTAACFAVTPDSKQLIIGDDRGGIQLLQLLQADDFSIQPATRVLPAVLSVAFDPTCRFLAVGCQYGTLELRSL